MDTLNGNATIRRGLREVRIITSDGYLMTTDTLHWKADAERSGHRIPSGCWARRSILKARVFRRRGHAENAGEQQCQAVLQE